LSLEEATRAGLPSPSFCPARVGFAKETLLLFLKERQEDTMDKDFREYAETLKKIEVLTVEIKPDGEYHVPSEKQGRITEVSPEQQIRLADYLIEFSTRIKATAAAQMPKKARSAQS
jgi:hypothetical protein